VSGGQTWAHEPEQLDFPLLSAVHVYSARPDAPVRWVPTEALAVPIVSALDVEAAWLAVDGALAVREPAVAVFELLPHAANRSDAPTAAAGIRNLFNEGTDNTPCLRLWRLRALTTKTPRPAQPSRLKAS